MVTFLLIAIQACKKDEPEINTKAEFEEYIADEMDLENIPAMSVLIFKGNTILYENYLGKSQLQQNINLSPNHLFLLASISKVITATALLQLYDDQLFSLDDPVNNHLPFKVNIPNQSKEITFRMLLTHTSAIADGSALDGQYYYGKDSPISLKSFLENYFLPSGNFYNAKENFHNTIPGNAHEYSNAGNALIALLVEEISGMDFNSYCKKNIFSPLGMNETFWRLDEITQTIVQPYNYKNREYEAINHYTFTDYPNGGLRSTSRDLFKFLKAFTHNGISNNHPLLDATTVQAMITPQIPKLDKEMGLHLFLMNPTNSLWGHDGGEQGVATIMAFNPNNKVGAIILTNQGDADLDEMLVEAYQLGLKL